jgi:phosphoglycerate dehydrogenase-like enzyme
MPEPAPRLLLVVGERPGMRETVGARLPQVPHRFLPELRPGEEAGIEAVLLGAMAREGADWDPRAFPRLRFVQRLFAGVDDLPFERFAAEVAVAGNVGGYSPFVAEHALALALACARCVRAGEAAVAAGRMRPLPELRSLWQESALILGYGSIGRAIAERLRPYEMRVSGVTRTGTAVLGLERSWPAELLEKAVEGVGYVFDARPLTRATRASLGAGALGAMREDATLVNIGRAGTVDEDALYRHLESHPRFRAGIDVWWQEDFGSYQLGMRHPFAQLPNFVGSPHWAGYAPRVGEYALGTALENLGRFFSGLGPRHLIDRADYVP